MIPTSRSARKILATVLALTLAPILFAGAGSTLAQTKRTTTRRASRATRRAGATNTTAGAQPVRVPQLPPPAPSTSARNTNATQGAAVAQPGAHSRPPQTPAPSQTPAPQPSATPKPEAVVDDDEVMTVNSNLVVVPASVTDASGAPVQGLKAEDFRLEEEGRAQKIAQVGDAEQIPLDIAILFDVSSSVSQKNFYEFEEQAAARFLKAVLKPTDRAAVVTITREPRLVQSLSSAEVAAARLTSIPAATSAEPTAFYDTVSYAAKYLNDNSPSRHRRVIVAITDGDDNFSNAVREQSIAEREAELKAESESGSPQGARAAARRDLEARHKRAVAAVEREVQRADAVFYSINPGGASVRLNEISTRAQNNMAQIADSTGGTAYVPPRAEDLETVFRQIASELRAQYLLQYYSSSDAPAGKFLNIKVALPTRPELKVRARRGYYAKKG